MIRKPTVTQQTTIRYTIDASPLGLLLIAASERGICAAHLGDDRDLLLAMLEANFPNAAFERDNDGLRAAVAAFCAYLEGRSTTIDVTLDADGTAFQRRVWAALRQIPCGETRTYGQLAAALGDPGSVRAVGAACGANRIALAIPCHRVVRADGGLGGFRWGIERKQALLALEAGLRSPRR